MREMKDSGFSWIGKIPCDWSMQRVKHAFYRKNEKAMQDNPVILSLARSGVRERDISNNEGQIAESYYNYNPVDVDDLLINPMDLYSGANCSISKIRGVISPAYINLRYKEGINPNFFDYYFKLQYWQMAFFSYGKGVSFENRWTLTSDTLMNYPIVVPSYSEQCNITAYLDNKCTKIDSIIEKQKKIIEKLKAYKLSVITEAVTKGLNPDVKMKDSGVEWIGDIPNNWEVIRIKWLLNERKERSETGTEEPLSMSQKYGLIPTKEMDIIPNMASTYVGAKVVYPNDLVFNKLKAHLGVFSVSKYYGLVSPDYAVYNSTDKADLKYLEYLFKTPQCILEFRKKSSGIAEGLTRLYTSGLFSIYCPFPKKSEQKQIADYLDKKCSAIDKSIEQKQAIIEKLKEYKKSLIYEVVTGKKEV